MAIKVENLKVNSLNVPISYIKIEKVEGNSNGFIGVIGFYNLFEEQKIKVNEEMIAVDFKEDERAYVSLYNKLKVKYPKYEDC